MLIYYNNALQEQQNGEAMKKRWIAVWMILMMVFACSYTVSAKETLTSDTFTIHVDVLQPDGAITPSDLRFNLFSESGEWL